MAERNDNTRVVKHQRTYEVHRKGTQQQKPKLKPRSKKETKGVKAWERIMEPTQKREEAFKKEIVNPALERTRQMSQSADKAINNVNKTRDRELKKKGYVNSLETDNNRKLQRQLYEAGFFGNIAYDKAVDGDFGEMSKAALNKAQEAGYIYKDGQLIAPKKEQSQQNQGQPYMMGSVWGMSPRSNKQIMHTESNDDPGFISDALNHFGRNNLLTMGFVKNPYEGTEEQARKLGYKYYTTDGFTRHPVNYSVPNQENLNTQQLAQAQLDLYGITQEQVRDKSPISTLVYEYSPGYGYNVARMVENIVRNNKIRENGKATTKTIETPIADKVTAKVADILGTIGLTKLANEVRENNTYGITESPQRSDLSNLYFGYPMNGKSLRISEKTETGNGNKPENGYFFEFSNDGHIYQDPAYQKASASKPAQASGENMGNWSASIDANGKRAYYDKWDINPLTHIPGLAGLPNMEFLGTGFELYGKQK